MEDIILKDIYHYEEEPDINDTLVRWFNETINKKPSEMTTGDLARSVRQNLFHEVVLERGIEELEKDPFAGELFTGELLEKILLLDKDMLLTKKAELKKILKKAEETHNFHCWGFPEEKDEYLELLKKLKKIINSK